MATSAPELGYTKNLSNVVALIRSATPPQKRYVIWAAILNPLDPTDDSVELRLFDFTEGQWVPIGSNLAGAVDAKQVHVKITGVTEAVGARGVADIDSTLHQLLLEVFVGYKAPAIALFSYLGSGSVVRPIGYPYAGGAQPFAWDTSNVDNVASPPGLTIREATQGTVVADSLPASGNTSLAVDAFNVAEGVTRQFEIRGVNTKGVTFSASLTISGSVYRYLFISDQNLLDTTAYPTAASISTYVRQQSRELNASRASGPATYSPRTQYVYLIFDRRGLDNTSTLGASFKVQEQNNNDFLTRDYAHTNEYGAANDMRIFRTANRLNNDYLIQSY